jgi:hypothetical protein
MKLPLLVPAKSKPTIVYARPPWSGGLQQRLATGLSHRLLLRRSLSQYGNRALDALSATCFLPPPLVDLTCRLPSPQYATNDIMERRYIAIVSFFRARHIVKKIHDMDHKVLFASEFHNMSFCIDSEVLTKELFNRCAMFASGESSAEEI